MATITVTADALEVSGVTAVIGGRFRRGQVLEADQPVAQNLSGDEETLETIARRVQQTQVLLDKLKAGIAESAALPIYDNQGRLIADANGFYIYDAAGNLVVDANAVQINTDNLADAAITTEKLADLAVDTEKLAALSVTAATLANSAVTATKIANAAVGTAAIANAAVGTAQIANAAITSALIGDAQIVEAKIADLAVTNAKIQSLAVSKLTAGTITTSNIFLGSTRFHLDGANELITIQDGQTTPQTRVKLGKLGAGTTDYGIEIYDSSGSLILGSGGVYSSAIANSSQQWSEISGAGKPSDNADVTASNPQSPSWLTSPVVWGSNPITSANVATYISSAAIGNAYIASLDAGKITTGTLSADRIGANSITAAKIAASTITSTEIATNAITAIKINASAITTDKINGDAVVTAKILNDAVVQDTYNTFTVTASSNKAFPSTAGAWPSTFATYGTFSINASGIKSGRVLIFSLKLFQLARADISLMSMGVADDYEIQFRFRLVHTNTGAIVGDFVTPSFIHPGRSGGGTVVYTSAENFTVDMSDVPISSPVAGTNSIRVDWMSRVVSWPGGYSGSGTCYLDEGSSPVVSLVAKT